MTELHLATAFSDPGNGIISQQTPSKVSQVTQLTSTEGLTYHLLAKRTADAESPPPHS